LTARLLPGRPWPLGSHCDGQGVNFALASQHATAVELCLFDEEGLHEVARIPLTSRSNDIWHGYLAGVRPGQVYGFRAHGPWQIELGLRFNAQKVLLDPYAREIVGSFEWRDEHFAHDRHRLNLPDPRDNAPWALKARVVATGARSTGAQITGAQTRPPETSGEQAQLDAYDWQGDQTLSRPIAELVLYEMHVKGFSKRNPLVPEALRGTFAGLAHPSSIAHLKRLGVSAVNLLPVHFSIDEERLMNMGLRNYWGYNTLGFFALNPRMVSEASKHRPRDEFRDMVKALHQANIEVLLDVVYNHTAESDEQGPSLSFRGLDNTTYYRLPANDLAHYENHTGCGNTIDIRQPRVLQLVLDSLRYWVEEMHVDGFRFDLATVLGRGDRGFDARGAFFLALSQDPILSKVKLIAEPWDIGPEGYQVGNFPPGWLEWNDQFRDAMRRFWLHGDKPHTTRGNFAMRLCGSADLYQHQGRAPSTSINYVVSHDGFTLRDLVSYEARHNLANGEGNRDGHGNNLNFNSGVEGPSEQAEVNALRASLQRVLLASTLLSQGTPMLAAGDELGHSQGGNNNPYCQDNEITWIDWGKTDEELIQFTADVIALRKQWLPFLANQWTTSRANNPEETELAWFKPDGSELKTPDWHDPEAHALACLIQRQGEMVMLFNPEHQVQSFRLPEGEWDVLLDTSVPKGSLSASRGAQLVKDDRRLGDEAVFAKTLIIESRIMESRITHHLLAEAHSLLLLRRRIRP
jgi:glycogen debranching enzyme GlgX